MDYQNLFLFVKIVEHGSLLAASRVLGVPTSTLSRRLVQLEESLGARLLHHGRRPMQLTEAGQACFERCQPLFQELEEAREGIDSLIHSPTGLLKMTAPPALTRRRLQPMLVAFMQAYPGIRLEMSLSNENLDLPVQGIDVAFRMGPVSMQKWISRSLFEMDYVICASPGYLDAKTLPLHPSALRAHAVCVTERMPEWRMTHAQSGEIFTFSGLPRVRSDDVEWLREVALAAQGVVCLARYVVEADLRAGTLVALFSDWYQASREVHLLYPEREMLPAKVRLLVDFARAYFA